MSAGESGREHAEAAALAADRAAAEQLLPDVSRETWSRLEALAALLLRWQRAINLVAPATLPHLWTRHIADSLQLMRFAGDRRRWIDLGSGGGFPGLVVACAIAEREGAAMHLVESDQRKAAFLREAARTLALPVTVFAERIEAYTERSAMADAEVVSARALAPLDRLLGLASALLKTGVLGVFPKGQDVDRELTESMKSWIIDLSLETSITDPKSRIVIVHRLAPRGADAR